MSRPLPYLFLLPLITSVLLVFTGTAVAKDWPTWRYDAGRTNISSEKIPELGWYWKAGEGWQQTVNTKPRATN